MTDKRGRERGTSGKGGAPKGVPKTAEHQKAISDSMRRSWAKRQGREPNK